MKQVKQMKQQAQKGFTLIELMIVVAIIGILAAVALPQYQSYTAAGGATACYQEIIPGKSKFEVITLTKAAGVTAAANAIEIGLPGAKACVSHAVTPTTIAGKLGGSAPLKDKIITLNRNSTSGIWTCFTDAAAADFDKVPTECRYATAALAEAALAPAAP